MLFKQLLLPAFASVLLPATTFAQSVTDPIQAIAARDSLFSRVVLVRQQLEQKSSRIITKTPKKGARRLVVRGYYAGSPTVKSAPLAWQHVIKHYRNGSSRELYTAYLEGHEVVIRERRHNGQLTWLQLQNYRPFNLALVPTFRLTGTYTADNYLRWNGKNYLLPARLPKL